MCIFEDLQELPFKFQYTETQKKNWYSDTEVMGGVCGSPKSASTVCLASYVKA